MTPGRLGALTAGSALLLLLAIFDPWKGRPPAGAGQLLLPRDLAARVLSIHIEDHQNSYLLSREGSDYRLQEPMPAPASRVAVGKLLDALRLLRSARRGRAMPLSEASLRISLTSSGDVFTLRLGPLTADGRHRWVELGNEAHLVEAHLLAGLDAIGGELVEHRIVPFSLSRKKRLRMASSEHWIELADGFISGTDFESPMPVGPGSRELYDQLQSLQFEEVALHGQDCQSSETVQLSQGSSAIRVHKCGSCGDEGVELQVGHRRGCASATSWRLIQSTLLNPARLAQLALLPTQPRSFTLHCRERKLVVDSAKVDASRLQKWWSALNKSVIAKAPAPVGAAPCWIELSDARIDFHVGEQGWVASVEGSPYGRELSEDVEELLGVSERDFLPLALVSEDAIFAKRIEIRRAAWKAAIVLDRDEMAGSWRASNAKWSAEQATEIADRLRSELSIVRAESFGEEAAKKRAQPSLEIVMSFDAALQGEERSYALRVFDGASCRISLNRGPLAAVEPSLCARLQATVPP